MHFLATAILLTAVFSTQATDNAQKPTPIESKAPTQTTDSSQVGDLTVDFTGARIIKSPTYSYQSKLDYNYYQAAGFMRADLANGAVMQVYKNGGCYTSSKDNIAFTSAQAMQWHAILLHRWNIQEGRSS